LNVCAASGWEILQEIIHASDTELWQEEFFPAVVVSKFAFASNLMQMIVGGDFESEQSKENSTTEEVWSNWRKFNCCKLRSRVEKLLN
jgi:hypothetical protein